MLQILAWKNVNLDMPSLHFVANYKCLKSSTLRGKVELFANLCIDIVSKAFFIGNTESSDNSNGMDKHDKL